MDTRFINEVYKDIDGLVEVREIDKEDKVRRYFLTIEELLKYRIFTEKNIYIGIFSRDKTKRDGTSEGCKTTGALWLDFDHMDITQAKSNIEKAKLPVPSIFINSGHGIHAYWLLDKRIGEKLFIKQILKEMAIATKSDTNTSEIARVMRLPESMNIKDEPVKCEFIEGDFNRYSLETFKDIFNIQVVKEMGEEAVTITDKISIPELLNADRYCIRSMANGVREGHRNFAEGRLIKYLQMKGKTKEKTKEIILKWNMNNEPIEHIGKLLADFEMFWKHDYKLLGCTINNGELQGILGAYCDRHECKINATLGKLKLNNTTKYNNRLFNAIDKISGNDLITLGLLMRHWEGLTLKKLTEKMTPKTSSKCCMSKPTLIGTLKYLRSIGLIECIEGNKRAGIENLYKAVPQGTYGLGYTICSNGAITGAIYGAITPSEFKLYVLLLKYAFQSGNCYPTQVTLAKELRITHNAISMMLSSMEKADYIKKNTQYLKGVESLIYTLLV